MPRAIANTIENHFSAGLITDFTSLTFPENAASETDNCVFSPRNYVDRRAGIDFENGFETQEITRSGVPIVSYTWKNAGGQAKDFVVIQVGLKLYIYEVNSNALSSGYKTSIDISSFSSGWSVANIKEFECQFASGNGYLFVTHPYLETFYVSYTLSTNTFATAALTPKIRDFAGVSDGLTLDQHPVTLSNSHKYNLLNQGWDNDKITAYFNHWGYYPASSEIWWLYRDANEAFTPSLASTKITGLSQAPKGHFLLNPYYQDRVTASGVSGLTITTSGYSRPSTCAFFSGRLFVGGALGLDYADKIYFSSVLTDVSQASTWYQLEDPTSSDFFDLLATDGGVISIPECGQIIKLMAFSRALLVFATNGIWQISGSQGTGFTANDYSVSKVGAIPSLTASSFVDVQGFPMWWNHEGIYTISSQNGQPVALTDGKIKNLFDSIPLNCKKYAKGAYNPVTRVVQWLYRDTDITSVGDKYSYNKILNFNALSEAFYPWSIDATGASVNGIVLVNQHVPSAFFSLAGRYDENGAERTSGVIRAVDMIPASTEWGYSPTQVYRDVTTQYIETVKSENGYSVNSKDQTILKYEDAYREGLIGNPNSDWKTSLDQLAVELPFNKKVNLFVSWFGDDLRCGSCNLYPAVTQNTHDFMPDSWSVGSVDLEHARVLSQYEGNPAYGGTPSDSSVVAAIQDLHARGLDVVFTPFILMDIVAGNTLTNPYTGTPGQPPYPWRGRITCNYGTNGTSSVVTQLEPFWDQYRAFVLHYANLCASAGGVEIFTLGTELRGLTWLRAEDNHFQFVTFLRSLAAEVKAILPSTKLTYSADWSEFTPLQLQGFVVFHLDWLWNSPHIDGIGIDVYWPLSDWRDGTDHLDYQDGYRSVYDYDYLQANIKGGEGYDWYYANSTARDNQVRTPISDGIFGHDWVFRYKDIWNWWSEPHGNYINTGEGWVYSPTGWIAKSKPIWFMEVGCPAVNKGSNQPNVFHDPKSSESFYPYYSSGVRDDQMQRRYLQAFLDFFDPNAPGFVEANNPQSTVYSGRMVDHENIFIYTWDARPYPTFPYGTESDYKQVKFSLVNFLLYGDPGELSETSPHLWGDWANYETGHWINGRLGIISSSLYSLLNTYALSSIFKYVSTYPTDSTHHALTFSDEHDVTYKDWYTYDSTGKDYSSYITSGYRVHGDALRKYQVNYLQFYSQSLPIPTKVSVSARWDSANTEGPGRWGQPQVLNFSDSMQYNYPSKRIKMRGHGKSMNLRMESVSGCPFRIVGWSTFESGNARP